MFVKSFSTTSRPQPCGRPPPAAVLGRQHDDRPTALPSLPSGVAILEPYACAHGWVVVAASLL